MGAVVIYRPTSSRAQSFSYMCEWQVSGDKGLLAFCENFGGNQNIQKLILNSEKDKPVSSEAFDRLAVVLGEDKILETLDITNFRPGQESATKVCTASYLNVSFDQWYL